MLVILSCGGPGFGRLHAGVPSRKAWSFQTVSPDRVLAQDGFAIGVRLSARSRRFITEQADTLFVECEVEYECLDTSGNGRSDARVRQKATGMYDQATRAFTELAVVEEELRCNLSNGTEQTWRNSYMRGAAFLGHRTVRQEVRHVIE
jgi:hypothetical protein